MLKEIKITTEEAKKLYEMLVVSDIKINTKTYTHLEKLLFNACQGY